MSRDKQITEIAKFVCNACEMGSGFDGECDVGMDYRTCGNCQETAEALYTAGYRLASEFAREIFAEIEEVANLDYETPIDTYVVLRKWRYTEIKKKYTEGEG